MLTMKDYCIGCYHCYNGDASGEREIIAQRIISKHKGEKKRKREMRTIEMDNTFMMQLPNSDYEFRDENGNVINAQKIVLEKKKPKYPESYKESLDILSYRTAEDAAKIAMSLSHLERLLVCRDAYWHLAGDWKPDWSDTLDKYIIASIRGEIDSVGFSIRVNRILAFPTKEMRDAFYENFKKEIESCKELL